MSAADLAAVLLVVATAGALVVLAVVTAVLLRTARELRSALERVRVETLPLVSDMRDTVAQAGAEVERVDELLDAAASIQRTVDSASRLTYVAFADPLIKVVAFLRGVARGVRNVLHPGARRRRRVEARRAEREARRAA